MTLFDREGVRDAEPNDVLSAAIATSLSAENPSISSQGKIGFDFDKNRGVDNTEDVDFYKFDLKVGDTVKIDIDTPEKLDSPIGDSSLRLFNTNGKELAANDDDFTPDEAFTPNDGDSYLEYTAKQDGTYYLGVSGYPNLDFSKVVFPISSRDGDTYNPYDPFTTGSGSGGSSGDYILNISLNDAPLAGSTDDTGNDTGGSTGGSDTGDSNGGPTVSLQTISGTYTDEDDVLATALVESGEGGRSLLTLALKADEPIPEGGLEVIINSDALLKDYFFRSLRLNPFTAGGEVLGAVFDSETGQATGLKYNLLQPNAFINLEVFDDSETETPEQITFSLESGNGYSVNPDFNTSTVTFYDTLDQVSAPTVTPEVSLSVDNANLLETEGTATTLTFNLSEPPPPEGVLVYVDSGVSNALAEFNVFNLDVKGGVFPAPNSTLDGFYFKVTEQTASITLSAFGDNVSEGLDAFNFKLIPGAGYTVDPDAGSATVTIADTPDSKVQISYGFDPSVQTGNQEEGNIAYEPGNLVESEGTVSVHKFSLSAPLPEGGVTISVKTPDLDDFDLSNAYVAGGEIVATREDGFNLSITDQNAAVTIPVSNDGEDEGREQVTFTIQPGDDYGVSPDDKTATFNIFDTRDRVPPMDTEFNDTIPQALNTNLSATNSNVSIQGKIGWDDNSTNYGFVDESEDVDFYKFDFKAGDTVKIDIDTEPYESEDYDVPQQLDSVLRLFDADGKGLLVVDNTSAPDESNSSTRDPYAEFTATADGTYYLGVSQLGNFTYDPFNQASGSGWVFPEQGINIGEYSLTLSLTPA